ncbi:3544_t:CDS:2 [Funneliformis mosseae]|uniref:3544_t:CDS:1 n=1 Tax=Funneliformis mosseae TaxID=27381 RepID=A0A9N9D148_FUNMO|nr:3544_t:CDS:2 [Funneliformis mosseae]
MYLYFWITTTTSSSNRPEKGKRKKTRKEEPEKKKERRMLKKFVKITNYPYEKSSIIEKELPLGHLEEFRPKLVDPDKRLPVSLG